ncbi:protein FANTASTIC FOUR 3 [Cocos nucifera]|uniref:Protein FANTASTIC FOUR 3 n=1 Tax=Cocos nucifera TaxID=13894 RepID=A0A8K0NA48_COCNU|nr:protein FANTASTIC FOUR 3 [Cocos nucifera]
MMTFFSKGVHTLPGFPNPEDRRLPPEPPWRRNISRCDGQGLRIIAGETAKPANVVEKTGPRRPPEKPDPGARGLHERCYDDGLGLCTESLGFESCCDGHVAAEEAALEEGSIGASGAGGDEAAEEGRRSERAISGWRSEGRKFPPPLSWLAGNGGRRSKYLVPERKDGRLMIKLKTVDRSEIFAATREEGRLQLRLIEPDGSEEDVVTEEEEEVEEDEKGERWKRRSGEIEGAWRCQEAVTCNEVVPLWWNHRFVTTA